MAPPVAEAVRLTDQYGRKWFVWGLPAIPDGMSLTGIEWDREGEFQLCYRGNDAVAGAWFSELANQEVTVLADNPDEPRH